MKFTKAFTRTMIICLLFAMCMGPVEALAGNRYYTFTFADTSVSEVYGTPEAKNDGETNWYLTIYDNGRNNMSAANVFGTRMNFALNEDGSERSFASGYHTFSNYVENYPMAYIYFVEKGDRMIIGGKKDTKSTSTAPLSVSGLYCPQCVGWRFRNNIKLRCLFY